MCYQGFEPKEKLYNEDGLFYLREEDKTCINEMAFDLYSTDSGLTAVAELSGSKLAFLKMIQERTHNVPYIFDPSVDGCEKKSDYFIRPLDDYRCENIKIDTFSFPAPRGSYTRLYSIRPVFEALGLYRYARLTPIFTAINNCSFALIDLTSKEYDTYNDKLEPEGDMKRYARHVCVQAWDVRAILDMLEAPPFSERSLFGRPKGGYSKVVENFRRQINFKR